MKLRRLKLSNVNQVTGYKSGNIEINLFQFTDHSIITGIEKGSKHEIEYKTLNHPTIAGKIVWNAVVELCILKEYQEDFFKDFPVCKSEYYHDDEEFCQVFIKTIKDAEDERDSTFSDMVLLNSNLMKLKTKLNLDINL